MAKLVYLGGGSTSRPVKKLYIGVNGVSKKIKRGYIGDESGKARLFFSSGYQWQRYSIIYTYSWKRYTISTSYSSSIRNTSGSIYDYDDRGWGTLYFLYQHRDPDVDSNGRFDGDWISGNVNGIDGNEWIITERVSRAKTAYYTTGEVTDNGNRIYYSRICTISTTNIPGSYIDTVTGSVSNQYPSNGSYGGYWYVSAGSTSKKGSLIDTVENDNENAYPANGISGNYWYVKIT